MTMRVNVSELNLREQADANDTAAGADPPRDSEGKILPRAGDAARLCAAYAWVWKRRTDPTFTYDQALEWRLTVDFEIVTESPEVSSGVTGVTPLPSPELGPSTRAMSWNSPTGS